MCGYKGKATNEKKLSLRATLLSWLVFSVIGWACLFGMLSLMLE